MNSKKWYYSVSFLFCLTCVSAQEIDDLKSSPAHVSIVHPVGIHGQQSVDYAYNFSLNLLSGKIGGLKGLEFSGLFGRVEDNARGFQMAGLANTVGYEMKGIQFSVFGNATGDGMKGIQLSCFANIVGDEMSGIQITGVFNRVHTLRGIQIGLVSVNDTIENGASFSLINLVKRGFYSEWELSFSDYANAALSFKMGAQKFYTVYTVGLNFMADNLLNLGVGFGKRFPIGNLFDFQPELIFSKYFPTSFTTNQSNLSSRLKFGFVYRLNEKFGLSFAPSLYLLNAAKNRERYEFYRISPIGALYKNEVSRKLTAIGVGLSIGLSMK